jgi:hypothetical protein
VRTIRLLTIAALALAGAPAPGQEFLVPQSADALGAIQPAGGLTVLAPDTPVISTTPLFLEDPAVGRPGATASAIRGHANGRTVQVVDGENLSSFAIGFDYLRPWWTHRDFQLAVPQRFAPFFPVLGDIGHVDSHFVFVPRVRYNYYFTNLDMGFTASGEFFNLTGRLQRDLGSAGNVLGNLVAQSSLTIVSITPAELSRLFEVPEFFTAGKHFDKAWLEDSVVTASLGTRYATVDQHHTGSIQVAGPGGVNVATRYASQNFRGFGLTGSANWQTPAGDNWVLFSNMRGSVLLGESRRSSTLTVAATGLPGFADTIAESKTTAVPVMEVEVGAEWGRDLGELLRMRQSRKQLTLRVAGVAQYWGGMGPLSAGSPQGFATTDLFLAGVSVQVGFRH